MFELLRQQASVLYPQPIVFECVRCFPMSSLREFRAVDPEVGTRRAYTAAQVAEMANVTSKTVTLWVSEKGTAPPAPLRGWAPRSEANPTGRWLIDADLADEAFGQSTPTEAMDPGLQAGIERLAEERALFDMERRMYEASRIEQLENENARLRASNDRLSSQVSKLGSIVRDLTADPVV